MGNAPPHLPHGQLGSPQPHTAHEANGPIILVPLADMIFPLQGVERLATTGNYLLPSYRARIIPGFHFLANALGECESYVSI